jgi:cardiolipin synthase
MTRIWTVPNILSFARIPLGVAFPLTIHRPLVALAILATASITDIVDGWWARTRGQVTTFGAVLDPITDKLFVVCVIVTLVAAGHLGWLAVLCMSTREIGEAPLVVWFIVSPRLREHRSKNVGANIPGKLATVLQFACVAVAIFAPVWTVELHVLLGAAAVVGGVSAASYWLRVLRTP